MVVVYGKNQGKQGGLDVTANRIDRSPRCAREIFRSSGLTPFRQVLDPSSFAQALPGPAAPHAVLVPEVVFWLMATVALGQPSMAAGVLAFWASTRAAMPELPLRAVTEEAFCLARTALPLRFFIQLFTELLDRFRSRFGPRLRWKGKRLLGIDGMELDLPAHPHLRRIFPVGGNQNPHARFRPQGRLVGLVGLWDGVCYAFRWTALSVSEQYAARPLLRALGSDDLLLADRNFPDLATFAAVLRQGADFLFHLPSSRFLKKTRILTPGGRADQWYVDLSLSAALRRRYPEAPATLRARILQYRRPGFRTSWLITSLVDAEAFSCDELVELYHQRWHQETFHREWKYTLQLGNLRSHTACGLLKEVLVQLTLNNAVRWIMADAAPEGGRPVDLQFLEAKRLILASVPAMTVAPARMLPGMYRELLSEIARCRIRVRPGRSYPRRWDARPRPKGHGRAAQPARATPTEPSHAFEI
jgi:hypothetical protein